MDRKQWTLDIELDERGFRYEFHGIGIVGFEPTRDSLARIVAKTINEYLPATSKEPTR